MTLLGATTPLFGPAVGEEFTHSQLDAALELLLVAGAAGFQTHLRRTPQIPRCRRLFSGEDPERQRILDEAKRILERAQAPDDDPGREGRRAELDAFSGYVVATSAARGERAPVNEAVLRLAQRVEQGELVPSPENAPQLIAALYAA